MAEPRPRAEVAADLVAHAQEIHDAAHPYDNRQVLVPTRLFNRLSILVRELRGLPAEIAEQE